MGLRTAAPFSFFPNFYSACGVLLPMAMLPLAQDARYALRTFRKNPAFTTVAVLSLALGIGANTAIFSLIDAVLLRWLPVRAPQQLTILARNPDEPSVSFNYPDYEYVRDHNRSFDGVIAYSHGNSVGMTVPGEATQDPQLAVCSYVSGNYFEVLGVPPAAGRVFSSQDNLKPGAHPYAVLSYDPGGAGLAPILPCWERTFGSIARCLRWSVLRARDFAARWLERRRTSLSRSWRFNRSTAAWRAFGTRAASGG